MSTSSGETQIARLRPTAIFAPHMHKWFLAGAAIGLLVAIVLWHPWPLMIAFFLGVVGFSEQRAGPNILAAILAYDCDNPTEGTVSVEISSWSDSETYHATVSEIGHSDWKYQFIPQGWQPASRSYSARIWRSNTEGRPLLAVVEEGILIPRYDPELIVSRNVTQGQ